MDDAINNDKVAATVPAQDNSEISYGVHLDRLQRAAFSLDSLMHGDAMELERIRHELYTHLGDYTQDMDNVVKTMSQLRDKNIMRINDFLDSISILAQRMQERKA